MFNLSKSINCQLLKSLCSISIRAYITRNHSTHFRNLHGNVRYLFAQNVEGSHYRGFKSCSLLFTEESDMVETNVEEKVPLVDPSKDRTKIIPPEVSIRYMKSTAYKTTYGDEPVWVKYRRNFKGQFIPTRTRGSCVRSGVIVTGNPCPICRDEYLVLDYTNADLLKQFINPYTGKVYDSRKIHLCRRKLFELDVALRKAKLYGYITYQVPFRKYKYKDYYPNYEA